MLLTILVFLQIFNSILSGDFHTPSNWSPSPNNSNYNNGGSTFIINVGHVMTSDARLASIKLIIYGTLIINDDRFVLGDSIILYPGASLSADPNITLDLTDANVVVYGDASVSNNIIINSPTLPVVLKYIKYSFPDKLTWVTLSERDVYDFIIKLNEKILYQTPGAITSYSPRLYEVILPESNSFNTGDTLKLYERTLNNKVNLLATVLITQQSKTKKVRHVIAYYDLLGRKVASNFNNLPRGTYIKVYNDGTSQKIFKSTSQTQLFR